MEDDDDAFLYGDEPAAPTSSKPDDVANSATAPEATSAGSHGKQASTDVAANNGNQGQGEDHDDEDEDEDEDSDSDVEFIIDANTEAQQQAQRSGFQRPGARPLPNQSTPQRPQSTLTSEYTPLSRSRLLANASPASTTAAGAASQPAGVSSLVPTPPGVSPAKLQTTLDGLGPEGGPPGVPSTAPRLNLSPGPEDRAYPKAEDAVEEEEAEAQDIFDIDLEALPEKPWRRYGADLTDYFNYGFNEETWSLWRGKKERMTDARKQAESTFFGGASNGNNGANDMMQQMMSIMPPPQAMQAMMGQMGQNTGAPPGPMGMPPMPPEQMMAMMASMSGMPAMPPMPPGMPPMMMSGMFGGQQPPNGPSNQQQQQQRFGNSPFPQGQGQGQGQQDGPNSSYPQSQGYDQTGDQQDMEHGWDAPTGPASQRDDSTPKVKEEDASTSLEPPTGPDDSSNMAMRLMSEADMSAFFGASGVDLSQVAAAGIPVATNDNNSQTPEPTCAANKKPTTGRAARQPSGPPPKTAPLGPSAVIKGTSIRGRAAAAAASTSSSRPRAVSPTLPPNVPSGPKNPGKRYNDRDTGTGAADSLDYGATGGGGADAADEWDSTPRETRESNGWDSPPRVEDKSRRRGRSRRESTQDHTSTNGRDNDEGGYSSRRDKGSCSRSSKRGGGGEDWDDETASQSSTSGRKRKSGSSREHHRDSHRSDRDREREKEREREARSQARSERRAGRDVDEPAIPTGPAAGVSSGGGGRGSRKRSAPEDRDREGDADGPPAAKTSSRSGKSGGSRKKR
ncbi:uncharacterized protein UBRO_04955 [Ustilago bromivora]|uniref:Pre-mRNA polyadenylation factor Fip1 domain-containing protein n=1 Tax=Ustilago bromivora TaxID=307758 RepID=A0A1K0G5S0_9BASI|nr:uncharacterized protein UBRO_04955 [Ustilago bromivora]SYW82838.1 uncharacterized protein UBRO2_04960 [Ustilago bromivora]